MSTTATMIKAIEMAGGDVAATLYAVRFSGSPNATAAERCLVSKMKNFTRRNPGQQAKAFVVGTSAFIEVA